MGVDVGVGAGVDVGAAGVDGRGVDVGSGGGVLVGSAVGAGTSVGWATEVASTVGEGGGAGDGVALGGGATPASGVGEGVSSVAGEPTPAAFAGPSVARAVMGANASGVINIGVGGVSRTTTVGLGDGAAISATAGDCPVAGVEVSTRGAAIFWIEDGASPSHPKTASTNMRASHIHRVEIMSTKDNPLRTTDQIARGRGFRLISTVCEG
jgi:hypothetical protein